MDSLKNCPFCGAEAVMQTFTTAVEKKPRFRVRCTNCPCDLGWDHWSVEEARDAWNKRTEGKDNDFDQLDGGTRCGQLTLTI